MRNIFLALLLANLAFAAWHSWFAPAPARLQLTSGESPDIMLASERGDAVAIAPAPLSSEEADAAAGRERAAAAGTEALADAGADTVQVARSGADAAPPADAAAAAAATPAGAGQQATPPDAESRATAADPANAAAVARGGDSPADRCVSVGPFRELSQAATAAANLRASGFDPVQRAGEGDVWVGYWVYIEQIRSVAEAEELLMRLREIGISDSYVIPRSDSGTLISLGVFTEIARASNRREEVRRIGLDATISDRTRRATVYWIEVQLAEGQLLDFELLQPPGRIIRLEQRPCAATG